MVAPLGVVTFDETGEEREIRAVCGRCRATVKGDQLDAADCDIVSPRGMAHLGGGDHHFGDGMTACGIDATGPGWWHRL